MMMPVMPNPKRASCFSIDALMSKADRGCDPSLLPRPAVVPCSSPQMCPCSSASSSPECHPLSARGQAAAAAAAAAGLTVGVRAPPPGMAAPGMSPTTPHPAFLHGANTVYPGGLPPGMDPATAAAAAAHPLFNNPAAASALMANGGALQHTLGFPPRGPHGAPHGIGGLGNPHMQHPGHQGFMGAPQPKDTVPFYSWLLSRHGNFLGQRFTGVCMLHPHPLRLPPPSSSSLYD